MSKSFLPALFLAVSAILPAAQDRILAPVNRRLTVRLPGHLHPSALPRYDRGAVDAGMPIDHATLLLRPAASLAGFLTSQQMPGSPAYRQWLTPEEFGDRFGLSANDLAKVVDWLESQGLKVDEVARGRHWINFSGTAAQASRTFHTEFHRFRLDGTDGVDGRMHFANTDEPDIPTGLAVVVAGFMGLNDFATHTARPVPQTNLANGSHALSPDDLAAIYNVTPLYAKGIDGAGQTIAIAGEVALSILDIQTFRKNFGLKPNDPDIVLVGSDPGPDNNLLIEADLDVEWAGAIARNSKIVYVYARDAFTAARYAIDQKLATVLSLSFGACEAYSPLAYRAVAQQANAQGITFIASSGDQGAATCDHSSPVPQASKGARATFPAGLPEVTAVGGTMFNEDAGNYWTDTGAALGYIPELAWNETVARGELAASGGGPSAFFDKPFWQTGPGVPDDRARDIPDISLAAAVDHDSYQVISRSLPFRVGGTSAAAPAFAGIVALLNQSLVSRKVLAQPGLGNINPELYRLAQSAQDGFHDITGGDNLVQCMQGSADCVNGSLGYQAGPGYDLATGLGSVDADRLTAAWGSGGASTTTVLADPSRAGLTDTVNLTVTVKGSGDGSPLAPAPGGTVAFVTSLDDALGSVRLTPSSSGSNATLSVPAQAVLAGDGTVYALFSGDAAYGSSAGAVKVAAISPATGSLVVATLTPNPTSVVAATAQAPVTVVLSEKAGVATTLIAATFNGTDIAKFFGGGLIPANGTLSSAPLVITVSVVPSDGAFHLAGQDADLTPWSRDLPIHITASPGPGLVPGIALSSSPTTVVQNPLADPGCQWSHQVTVRETGGFYVQLATIRQSATDLGSSVQPLFGTTRLAPFGSLTANICLPAGSAPGSRTFQATGTTELGGTVSAALAVNYVGPATAPATMSVSAKAARLEVGDPGAGGAPAGGAIDVSFTGGSPQWTVAASPVKPAWLTFTPPGGTGAGRVTLSASSTGLSKGVYTTTLSIQSAGSLPQAIQVPVTFVVGSSTSTVIGGVLHGASFQAVFAPGMVMSVFGANLAPKTVVAGALPLPLSLAGVSATVNGVSAPIYFVSPGQLNVQVPYETGLGTAVLAVNNNGQVSSFPFQVSVTAPGIFVAQDGSALLALNPAKAGDLLLAFITGDGDLAPTLATGATPAPGTALSRLPKPRQAVTMTIGGLPADISKFVGVPTGLAGVTQINFIVPPGVPAGLRDVVVTVGGVPSAPAKLRVQ